MSTHSEKLISSEIVYEGKIIQVSKDVIELENGRKTQRDVVHHQAAACVVPVFDNGEVCIVRQYRHPMRQEVLEIPAGKADKGEETMTAAKRELEEECGLVADYYVDLGEFYSSVGFTDEVIHLYAASGLHQSQQNLDDDEFLTPDRIPLEQLYQMILKGEIKDGKTIAAILKVKALMAEGKFLLRLC